MISRSNARSIALFLAMSVALVASVAITGCTDETIVLATIQAVDGGSPPPPPTRCLSSLSCPTGYYCSMSACGDQTGTCVLPPVVCDPSEAPVCGCDNITYFNDCLRKANGIAASTPTPCQDNPILCGGPGGGSCPDGGGAMCAQLGLAHGPCDNDLPGTCWVLPAQCPSTPPMDLWDSCTMGGPQCLDTCSAIQAGGAYHRSQRCP